MTRENAPSQPAGGSKSGRTESQAKRTRSDPQAPHGVAPVALALSGGGFRSAGFHLGVLTVLHRCGLLDDVRVLSTTSAGTLVGAYLVLETAREHPFEESHFALSKFLVEGRPIANALKRAARRRITLTQALAIELEETLLSDSRHAIPTMREIYESRTVFEEGSFNAAEARSGRPFRFSFSRGTAARIGHETSHLPRVIAEHIHVADVIAASCAFPGAFEPLLMPDDFRWPDADLLAQAKEALEGGSVGLVEGGVHDNQAIDGLLLASKRHDQRVALHIVSDADRGLEAEEPRRAERRWWPFALRVWHVSWASWLLVLAALATIFLAWKKVEAERAIHDFRWPTDAIAFGTPLGLSVAVIVAVLYARFRIRRAVQPLLPPLGRRGWRSVRRLRVVDLVSALQTRVRTLGSIATGAHPRRVRSLVYQSVWNDSSLVGRRIAVQIGALTGERFALVDGLYAPNESVLACVRRSGALPTAFELSGQDELDDLLITGQATMIARLVEHLELRGGPIRSAWPIELAELDAKLRTDWDTLNTTGRPLRP